MSKKIKKQTKKYYIETDVVEENTESKNALIAYSKKIASVVLRRSTPDDEEFVRKHTKKIFKIFQFFVWAILFSHKLTRTLSDFGENGAI